MTAEFRVERRPRDFADRRPSRVGTLRLCLVVCTAVATGCGQAEDLGPNGLVQAGADTANSGQVGFENGDVSPHPDAGSEPSQDDAAALPKGPHSVSIAIAPGARVVGDPAKVRCSALDDTGVDLEIETGWTLAVAKPVNVVSSAAGIGLAVVSEKTGTFGVVCVLNDGQLESDSANVTYIAGGATQSRAIPAAAEIVAGEVGTEVKCELSDSFGNLTTTLQPANTDPAPAPAVTTIDVPEDMKWYENLLSGTKAGNYEVTCGVDGADLTKLPGKVTVKAGPPDFSKAVVKPSSATVDESIDVACTAFDKYGNVVEEQPSPWKVDLGAACKSSPTAAGATLSCTKSGDHEVRCEHASVPDPVVANLEILPGKPVKLTLKFQPDLPNYSHGQQIQLIGEGTDKYGNINKDVPLKPIKVTPSGAKIDVVNAQLTFGEDGLYKVTVSPDGDTTVSASRPLRVDTNGPLINVTSPKRGSTAMWASKMTVTFSVADELSGLGNVTINGVKPNLGDGIGVKHTIVGKHGLNVIKIVASDEFGNSNELVQSFYAARQFAKTESKDALLAKIPHGIDAFLGQKAIDSGYRYHSKPKDLATVLEIVLKNLDIKALIGQSFAVDQTAWKGTATITKFNFGSTSINKGYPQIKLTATSAGLVLDGTIHNVLAEIYLDGKSWWNPSATAEATASSLNVKGTIKVSVSSSGTVKATTSNVTVKLNNLKVKVKDGWGFLVNWLIGLFNSSITKLLQDTLQGQISSAIDGPLGTALQAFALDQTFTLPGFFGAPATAMKLTSSLQTLTSYGPSGGLVGGIKLGLKAALTSNKKVPYKILGSVKRRSCLKTYQTYAKMPRKSSMEIAMHLDLANQMFTSLWQAGGLKLKVPTESLLSVDLTPYQVSDVSVDAQFLLPPLVSDCTPSGEPEIQLGDVQLDVKAKLSGEPVILRVYMSAAAGVKLVAEPGPTGKTIGLQMSPPHLLESDVDSVLLAGKQAPISTQAFFQQLLPLVAGQLIGLFQGTLASIPLPELDLSLLATSIPKGTVLAIDVQSVYSKPGNVHADGKVK